LIIYAEPNPPRHIHIEKTGGPCSARPLHTSFIILKEDASPGKPLGRINVVFEWTSVRVILGLICPGYLRTSERLKLILETGDLP
jgi:hypothetical protein